MPDITSSNSSLAIGIAGLVPVPVTMQGFGPDDAYSMPDVDNAEVKISVDNIMSYGWVPQIKTLNITLQADSPLIDFFEAWYAAEEATQSKLPAFGALNQPSIGRTYDLANGVLSGYSPLADGKRVLEPRRFAIKFQVALGAPTA
jgi:hypothetical protein